MANYTLPLVISLVDIVCGIDTTRDANRRYYFVCRASFIAGKRSCHRAGNASF